MSHGDRLPHSGQLFVLLQVRAFACAVNKWKLWCMACTVLKQKGNLLTQKPYPLNACFLRLRLNVHCWGIQEIKKPDILNQKIN